MGEAQQTPAVHSTPYQSPMYNYGASIMTLTNPDDELYKMELAFRGYKLDKKGNPIKSGDPLMNEEGICAIVGLIQPIVSRITIMNDLKQNEIIMLTDFLGDTLAKDLMVNRIKYQVGAFTKELNGKKKIMGYNPSARDRIYFISLSSAFICMKRACEGGDRRFWKGSQQNIRTEVVNPNASRSILSKLNPWKLR